MWDTVKSSDDVCAYIKCFRAGEWTFKSSFYNRPGMLKRQECCMIRSRTAVGNTAKGRLLGLWGSDWGKTRNKQHLQQKKPGRPGEERRRVDNRSMIKEAFDVRRQRPPLYRENIVIIRPISTTTCCLGTSWGHMTQSDKDHTSDSVAMTEWRPVRYVWKLSSEFDVCAYKT